MSPIIWGLIALVLLFVLALFAKNRFDLGGKVDIFSVDDLMSAGVVGCLFGVIFFPFFVLYSWIWPDVALPVEDDDPIWGRNVNKKVVEDAFLTIQAARVKRDPRPLKDEFVSDIYRPLKSECEKLVERRQMYLPQDIKIDNIALRNERIDKYSIGSSDYVSYRFDAMIFGTMVNALRKESDGSIVAGKVDRVDFDASLSFEGRPGDPFGGWLLKELDGPAKPHRSRSGH